MGKELTIQLDDLLWLISQLPKFDQVSDQPRFLKICHLAYVAQHYEDKNWQHGIKYGIGADEFKKQMMGNFKQTNYPVIESMPKGEFEKAVEFRLSLAPDQMGHNKVGAIKVMREITGLGLKEAKDAVEQGAWTAAYMKIGDSWEYYVSMFKGYGYEVVVNA